VFHHPLYSSGETHGSDTSLRDVIEPLLLKYNVSLVLNGHDHFYERIKPQKGIQYFVIGSGGQLRKGNIDRSSGLTEKGYDVDLAFMAAEITGENGGHELWALVLEAARLDEVVEQVIRTLEFSVLAKFAFSLAQSFNGFYNLPPARSSILREENADVQRWRAAGIIYVRDQLARALDLMGVEVPRRMQGVFTLPRSHFSVRVQVRFELRSSGFGVRGSGFAPPERHCATRDTLRRRGLGFKNRHHPGRRHRARGRC